MAREEGVELRRFGRVGAALNDRLQQIAKLVARRYREEFERVRDYVHLPAIREVELEGHSVRIRIDSAIGDVRYSGGIREARGHGDRLAPEQRRLTERGGFLGWREGALDDDALRVIRANPRVLAP